MVTKLKKDTTTSFRINNRQKSNPSTTTQAHNVKSNWTSSTGSTAGSVKYIYLGFYKTTLFYLELWVEVWHWMMVTG